MNITLVYLSYFISLNILVCTLSDDCRRTPTHVEGNFICMYTVCVNVVFI